ncbi:MAG: ABC transporter ATP-binding protein [Ignavibacteria bacterium]|nr:ABC transporter ATP-binding protein [Ignavibacteria bacterium]
MNSIEVVNLTKKFGKFTAVDNISFNVAKGEVFGFLGANGSGKSTTIRMLCGIILPTSGEATVNGFSIMHDPEKVKTNIGYMSQKFSLYGDLSVEENINFFGGIYGIEKNRLNERKDWVLEMSGLTERRKTLSAQLSVGFKQRLALGCAVLHEPAIVFLDEPTGGVDPISRRNFWKLINELSANGTTVFVTTHNLDEAEFCNRIILLDYGKIVASGSPKQLKEEIIENGMLMMELDDVYGAYELLEKNELIRNVSIFGNALHASLSDSASGAELASDLIKSFLESNGITVRKIRQIIPSLEDVFLETIEKQGTDD